MSKQNETVVESRVVQMTLDNQSFERNATQSISTITKLKNALDFSDAGKGLDDISRASKNIKLETLTNGLQAASNGFSAMEAVAFGALANIGAKISDTATKIGKMFTVDPIHDGFSEYELKMDSVQTIMASTGESLDTVNQYLEELNLYADKTIYSFSDMTSSIGKFTNAGVSLEDAVAAIQGISNEAAVSGANAQQASHAMYNFAQALSSGFVKLIDWKSIENANMATVEFKEQLLETAVEVGTVAKASDGMYEVLTTNAAGKAMKETIDATHNFNDSLQNQWMTTEVLTQTLAKYADETSEIGRKAAAAATEVKTFKQLVDTLKEAAGSGWAQTWEILVGDFNQAKELFTFLSNRFGRVIDGFSKSRNDLLRAAMDAPDKYVTAEDWASLDLTKSKATSLAHALIEVGKSRGIQFVSEDVNGLIDSLSEGWVTATELQDALNMNTDGFGQTEEELESIRQAALRVIRGDYGNDMAERFRLLEEEGFDAQQVQDYVNALKAAAGGTWNITEEVKKEADAVVFSTDALAAKTDEELRALGWSEKRIKNLRDLQKEAEKTGTPLSELMNKLEEPEKSGRENLFEAIKNAFSGIQRIVLMVKTAWKSVFPPASADGLRSITEKINTLSQSFKTFAINNARKIYTFFKGLFSLLAIGVDIVKALAVGAFTILGKAIGFLAPIIGGVLVKIGEMATSFRNWLIENQIVEKAIAAIGSVMETVGEKIKWFVDRIGAIFNFGGAVVGLFIRQMDRLGGFSFENVIKSFNFVKRAVFDYLERKFPVFGKIRAAIDAFTSKIKDGFNGLKERLSGPFEKFFGIIEFGKRVVGLFTKRMEMLGGFSFHNFIESFKFVKDYVLNFLSNRFPGFAKFREGFDNLAGGIKSTVTKLFSTISGLFGSIFGTSDIPLKERLETIKTDLTAWFASLPEKFNTFKDNVFTFFSNVWTNISTALSNAWPAIKEGFTNLWTSIKDWFKNVGGIDLSFLEGIFKGLRIAILVVAGVIGVALGGIALAIVGVVAAVKAGWKAISGFFKSITQNEAIKSGAGKIKTKFSGAFGKIGKVVQVAREAFDLFMKKLKSLGGFSFKNVVESFNFVKEKVFKYFEGKFPGFAKFREGFSAFTTKLKEGLTNLGLDSDGLKSKWHRLTTFSVDAFTKIYTTAKSAGSKAVTAVNGFINNPTVKKNLANFKAGFVTLWDSMGPAFAGIKDKFKEFLEKVNELGGFKFDNIGAIWEAFKNTIGEHFKNFQGFEGIKTAVSGAWEDIKQYISDHGFDISGIEAKFTEFGEGLKKIFEDDLKVPEIWDKFVKIFLTETKEGGKAIKTESDSLLEKIGEFFNSLRELFTGEDGIDIPAAVTDFISLFTNLFSSGSEKSDGILKTESERIVGRITNFKKDVSEELDGLEFSEGTADFFSLISKMFSTEAQAAEVEITESTSGFTSGIIDFITKLKEAVEGLSIPERLTEFLSSFQHTQEAIAEIGKPEEEGGSTLKDVIIGFLTDLKDVLKEIPFLKLAEIFGIITGAAAFFEIGRGVNNLAKGFKSEKVSVKLAAMTTMIGAIGGIVSAVLLYSKFGSTEKLESTCTVLGEFLLAVAGIFTAADILVEHLGTGLGDGSKETQLTSTGQVVNNIFDKLFSEAGLIGIVLSAGHALTELASVENFDAEAALKGAEAIALVVGTVLGMDWLSDLTSKLPSAAPDKAVIDVVSDIIETVCSGALMFVAVDAIKALMEFPDFNGDDAVKASEAISGLFAIATIVSESIGWIGSTGVNASTAINGLATVGTVLLGAAGTMGLLGLFAGIADWATSSEAGTAQKYIVDFIETGGEQIKTVVRILGEIIGELGGGILNGLMDGATHSLPEIGERIEAFAKAIKPLTDEDHSLDETVLIERVGTIKSLVEELTKAGLGVAMKNFATEFLNELSSNPTDSILGKLKKKSALDEFGEAVDKIAEIVTKWNETFPDGGDLKFDSEGFQALIDSTEKIPTGGLVGFIERAFGVESATESFADDMGALGQGIKNFSDKAAGVSVGTDILNAVTVIKLLAEAAAIVGGEATSAYYAPFIDFLMGVDDGPSLATALAEFTKSIKLHIKPAELNTLVEVAKSAKNIGIYANSLSGITISGTAMADVTLIDGFCQNIQNVVDALTYTTQGDYSSVDAFATAVEKIAQAGLEEVGKSILEDEKKTAETIQQGFSDSDWNAYNYVSLSSTVDSNEIEEEGVELSGAFVNAAKQMVAALASTIQSDESANTVKGAVAALIETINDTTASYHTSFISLGRNFTSGLIVGISEEAGRLALIKAAASIARAALETVQSVIKSSSPSKETMKLGRYFTDGFVIGIGNGIDETYRSAHGLGSAAVEGLTKSVRAINAMIDSGLDAEPVIRPVLDLSNVQNGAASLNGMLSFGAPIGVAGSFGAINANVNARNVATNADILSALTELGNTLNSRPVQSNTYNVNGVTYDDGTNVSEAVRSLIHAARIERRV